uniref:Uncharacterized protein n=1 Tax=Micrurus spixii TaxID=129469 RepID=A0A2D4LPK7_9SAUR
MSKQKHFLALLLPRSFLQRIPCQSLKLSLKIESAILLHIIHQKISNPQCRQLHPLHTAHRILHVMTGKFCRHLHGPPPAARRGLQSSNFRARKASKGWSTSTMIKGHYDPAGRQV